MLIWAMRRLIPHLPLRSFGIMNEPHDMATSLVLQNDQAAIDGIRASGAQQLILAPGNGYTGEEPRLQCPCSRPEVPPPNRRSLLDYDGAGRRAVQQLLVQAQRPGQEHCH